MFSSTIPSYIFFLFLIFFFSSFCTFNRILLFSLPSFSHPCSFSLFMTLTLLGKRKVWVFPYSRHTCKERFTFTKTSGTPISRQKHHPGQRWPWRRGQREQRRRQGRERRREKSVTKEESTTTQHSGHNKTSFLSSLSRSFKSPKNCKRSMRAKIHRRSRISGTF